MQAKGYGGSANVPVNPSVLMPSVVGEPTNAPMGPSPSMSVAEICAQLVALGRQRRFCIKSQSRCDRSIESYIAGLGGFRTDLDKEAREKLFDLAKRTRIMVEKPKKNWSNDSFAHNLDAIAPMVLRSAASRKLWDDLRVQVEKDMKSLAKKLPVWNGFAKEVKGFGELGLSVVIAEAGRDLSKFPTVAKLWKMLGLGMTEIAPGVWERQRKRDGALAEKHKYNPLRRAEMWVFFSDAMFRSVWRGDRDEDGKSPKSTGKPVAVPAHPLTEYGAEYARRKEHTANSDRGWTNAHIEWDARRIMTKCLIRDLWVAWRSASASMQPKRTLPTASFSPLPMAASAD